MSWPAGRVVNTLDLNPKRVSERVRSRPGHIQKLVNTKRVCRMRLKTVVPCTGASMPGQVKDPTHMTHRVPPAKTQIGLRRRVMI
jgi:hypothetical protein